MGSTLRRVTSATWVLMAIALLSACGSSPQPKAPTPQDTNVSEVPAEPGKAAPPVVMPTGPAAQFKVSHYTSAGPIMVTTLKGAKSGVTGKVWVWTPPEYKDPKYAKSGFPVLMLYTGSTGVNYNFWAHQEVEPIQPLDVRLIKARQAHPFIMVMPILQLSLKQDTECSDRVGQPKMGTWLAKDVVDMVKANFRTLPTRDGWGMAGASSGAFCAAKLTLQNPKKFKAAVSWGGYFVPEPETGPRWSQHDMLANSPAHILQHEQPDVRLLLLAGDKRKFHVDVDRMNAFTKLVPPPTVVTTYIQPGGGHYTADLKKLIPRILKFLTKNLQGPVAG